MVKFSKIHPFMAHRIREAVANCTRQAAGQRWPLRSGTVIYDSREELEINILCSPAGLREAYDPWYGEAFDQVSWICEPLFSHSYTDKNPKPWERRA